MCAPVGWLTAICYGRSVERSPPSTPKKVRPTPVGCRAPEREFGDVSNAQSLERRRRPALSRPYRSEAPHESLAGARIEGGCRTHHASRSAAESGSTQDERR